MHLTSRNVNPCRMALPTEELVYPAPCNCPTCGSTSFLKVADRVFQVLEHVPASVKIARHVEKRMICERGKLGPGLLAHIMVAKFDDHIPVYRLSEMYDRLGIDIFRSVMADWVGRVSALLTPLVLLLRAHIAAVDRIHTDDTPARTLSSSKRSLPTPTISTMAKWSTSTTALMTGPRLYQARHRKPSGVPRRDQVMGRRCPRVPDR